MGETIYEVAGCVACYGFGGQSVGGAAAACCSISKKETFERTRTEIARALLAEGAATRRGSDPLFLFRFGRVLVGLPFHDDQLAVVPEHLPGASETLRYHQ